MNKLKTIMSEFCEVKAWDIDIFHLGTTTLEVFRREVLLSDFALLILYPDDKIVKRDKSGYAARDNIMFELGLLMEVFGKKTELFLSVTDKRGNRIKKILIPSDLEGLTRLDMVLVDDEITFDPDIQIVCNAIKEAIERRK